MLKLNLIIKSKSAQPLVLNEAFDSTPNNKKYIFSGVFTACSVPGHVVINRNNRSYPEQEVLKHLGYLREAIQLNGCLLGELDHPEGRYDVQLKEASHKITDLWYDQNTHCVMGKLELLDTPNGQIAKNLVEAKYPLFVSSRAAGDVNEKTREVTIAQIFTYDIVCTPGFAEAKLSQVSESLNVSADTMTFLNESVSATNKLKKDKKYKVLIEGVSVTEETDIAAPINEKAMKMKEQPIDMKKLCTPLLEDDEEFQLPQADVSPNAGKEESSDNDDNKEENTDTNSSDTNSTEEKSDEENKENLTDEEKKENRALILNITSEDAEGDSSEESDEDADKSEKRQDIVSIESSEEGDETSDEESSDEEDSTESTDTDDAEDVEEDEEVEAEKAKKIEAETKKDMDKFQDILNNLSKVESVKESIISNYPFAQSLSPANFAKFAALKPIQKQKCARFIVENNIFDIKSINELWATPLNQEKRLLKNWLRLASPEDIALYTAAPLEEQNAIENMARYCILETKQDVDEFWDKTGLRQRAAKQQMNEEFVRRYKVVQKPMMEVQRSTHPLGYTMDYVAMTEEMYDNM